MFAFDVAGTTVNDDGLVLQSFEKAFLKIAPERWNQHRDEWMKYAIDTMGQSKIDVFTKLLGDPYVAEAANERFEQAYLQLLEEVGVTPIEGAEELFEFLRDQDIAVVLTTGFSRTTLDAIISRLGWNRLVNLSVVPGEAGAGRPSPAMIQFAANSFGITDTESVVVVGDTESDMKAGVSFGAGHVIGVLSGAHKASNLVGAGATKIVNSVADIRNLVFA